MSESKPDTLMFELFGEDSDDAMDPAAAEQQPEDQNTAPDNHDPSINDKAMEEGNDNLMKELFGDNEMSTISSPKPSPADGDTADPIDDLIAELFGDDAPPPTSPISPPLLLSQQPVPPKPPITDAEWLLQNGYEHVIHFMHHHNLSPTLPSDLTAAHFLLKHIRAAVPITFPSPSSFTLPTVEPQWLITPPEDLSDREWLRKNGWTCINQFAEAHNLNVERFTKFRAAKAVCGG